MQLASEVVIGIVSLVLGFALLWFGMPNKIGENPRFLRNGLMEMVYPAVVLIFIVFGVAELLAAWF
jgi:hypothetical protein